MAEPFETQLDAGATLRVEFLTDRSLRVRVSPDGAFADTGLNRYGYIAEPDAAGLAVQTARDGDATVLRCGDAEVRIDAGTGRLAVGRVDGDPPRLQQVGVEFGPTAASARFAAAPDEDWTGFGDLTRERLFHRGHVCDCRVCNVTSYVPVPFFMSTRGVAVLVNTTHRVTFDMARAEPAHFSWRDRRGVIDYYVLLGDGFGDLLDAYTELTGRPKLPPVWAFGLWYICRNQANDFEAVSDALNFRREGIPCDVLGLEPGWMETSYDLSVEKRWSDERFPIPSYCTKGPHNFFNAIQRMGFRMELWLCNEYDLSHEAERRAQGAAPDAEDGGSAGAFHEEAEQDEHFSLERAVDQLTRIDEPWFQHLKKFVDQGIDFFKQDGAFQVLEHPDRVWGNGMLDDEMHNLYPLFYVRQMYEGFAEHTNRRPVVFTPAGWAGFQAWCGTWTGDTGGRLDTLGAMLNTSLVGHSWATNDMEVAQEEGIHFGYLQPWSQINSWNYFRMPWIQGEELSAMHRFYARLRARLIPYIYSWAREATRTGYPLMAPLTLEFPDDAACRDCLHQYLLGRDLMVTIYKTDTVFPEGRWKDFWTGEVIEGGQRREMNWPKGRGGGLFVREGGIVTMGPVMQYRGEAPVDPVELYAFPGGTESRAEFYEDDGVSFKHQDGAFATNVIRAKDAGGAVTVTVEATQGKFDGQCADRKWAFTIALDAAPVSVSANGDPLGDNDWSFDEERREVQVRPQPGPVEITVRKPN